MLKLSSVVILCSLVVKLDFFKINFNDIQAQSGSALGYLTKLLTQLD